MEMQIHFSLDLRNKRMVILQFQAMFSQGVSLLSLISWSVEIDVPNSISF